LFNWLRENPHRLHLGRIGFAIEKPQEIRVSQQTPDLWTGALHSEFEWQGQSIIVETECLGHADGIGVKVRGRIPVVPCVQYSGKVVRAAGAGPANVQVNSCRSPSTRRTLAPASSSGE
jgi:hypothetical protein